MPRETYVKSHTRKNKKSGGKHRVRPHKRRLPTTMKDAEHVIDEREEDLEAYREAQKPIERDEYGRGVLPSPVEIETSNGALHPSKVEYVEDSFEFSEFKEKYADFSSIVISDVEEAKDILNDVLSMKQIEDLMEGR